MKPYIKKLTDVGHLSPFEHASFTFGVEGVSRASTHQLVRHRVASFSHQSQRYVKANEQFERIVPASISSRQDLFKKFDALMSEIGKVYQDLVAEGVPAEDARFVLPNAAETKIIFTMNARELLHLFAVRTCNRAQWEIRAMAEEMLRLLKATAPLLFRNAGPGCVFGACPEKDMCCGKSRRGDDLFSEAA